MAGPINLLIVDDEPDIQQLIKRYFSKQGFVVECAGSGLAMHQQLLNQEFEVILLDVCLPDISGFDLLPEIKARVQSAVIMLTGQDRTEQK
ncbi:MAG: response regulator, partial [Methylococcales bacterium]|nr:response regulator [Methylococcales bacterium]